MSDQLIRAFCEEMRDIKILLKQMAAKNGAADPAGGGDLVYQFPDQVGAMFLPAGDTFRADVNVNRPLRYLSVDVPDGVIVTVFRDHALWLWASDEVGAMELRGGVFFGAIGIEVVNNSPVAQKWSVRAVFGG